VLPDSDWHVKDKFFKGRDAIRAFLKEKWEHELDYKLVKELWWATFMERCCSRMRPKGFKSKPCCEACCAWCAHALEQPLLRWLTGPSVTTA
jgi:hypothetical protein